MVISIELITWQISRMFEASVGEMLTTLLRCCNVWYTCSKMGRTCTMIIGSLGFMADSTSLIQLSFWPVSVLISHDNCCRSERSTPWLKGRGCEDKSPGKSTWHKTPQNDQDQTTECHHHKCRCKQHTWEHNHDTIDTSLLCNAAVNASPYLCSPNSLDNSLVGSGGVSIYIEDIKTWWYQSKTEKRGL